MKHLTLTLSLIGLILAGSIMAQDADTDPVTLKQHGPNYVDANGDGYNDNAPDHDGDGIPNGLDEDYTGPKSRKGKGRGGFVDADGDGINDNIRDDDGDGIPNRVDEDYVRPQDGSQRKGAGGRQGNKQGMNTSEDTGTQSGMGDCDGTGSKKGKRGNRK